jgi:5-methylcytosine-specific restriction endonuclease McrA
MGKPSTAISKTCKVCGETKLITGFDKWLLTCKECKKIDSRQRAKEYYHKKKNLPEFKEKIKERFQKERTEKRERFLEKKRAAYLRSKEWYNSNWHARRAIAAGATEVDRSITISRLLERDSHICGICGFAISKAPNNRSESASIDHIIPLKLGGQHTWGNVRAAHFGCNNSKGNRKDGEFTLNPAFSLGRLHSEIQKSACQLLLPV